jgi:hypothetical protein
LLGFSEVNWQPVLVAVDGSSRLGRAKRFSILFHVGVLQQAALAGWSEYRSSSGEQIIAMHPRLLSAYVETLANGVIVDPVAVADAAGSSGLLDDQDEASAERTRTVVTKLVRRSAFGRDVCAAYGNKCGLCGITLGLPEGAHIYPAGAPNSPDAVWNGVALCRNHHRVFDLHRLWIAPGDGEVRWHPEILDEAGRVPIVRNFVDNTRGRLAMPQRALHRPRQDMFERRYEFAGSLYDWAA